MPYVFKALGEFGSQATVLPPVTEVQIRETVIALQKALGTPQTGTYDTATHEEFKKRIRSWATRVYQTPWGQPIIARLRQTAEFVTNEIVQRFDWKGPASLYVGSGALDAPRTLLDELGVQQTHPFALRAAFVQWKGTVLPPCPPDTVRMKDGSGRCETIPCPRGYTRDVGGQCRAPSPVDSRCPGRLQVIPSRCSAPDGTHLVYEEVCRMLPLEAPRRAGYMQPPPPTCTAGQLIQGKYTGLITLPGLPLTLLPTSQADCPPGATFFPGVPGGYAPPGSGISPSPGILPRCIPPRSQADCQTGYVFQPVQDTDPAKCIVVPTLPPVEVPPIKVQPEQKTISATSMDWISSNWKWLAAIAVVGSLAYWWTKRKRTVR